MRIQFLTPEVHGVLDYLAAGALIVLPFLLNLTGVGLWLSVTGGTGLIAYSLLTDYRFAATRVLSYDVHLTLDVTAAAAFVVAPFALNFDALTSAYYFVMAAGVLVVVALSAPTPMSVSSPKA